MRVTALIKMLALFLLAGLATAAPTSSVPSALGFGFDSSSDSLCIKGFCQPELERCFWAHEQDDGDCRDWLCGQYVKQCGSCGGCTSPHPPIEIPSAVGTSSSVDERSDPSKQHCMYICTHTTCLHQCITSGSPLPIDLANALVITVPATNHSISISISTQPTTLDSASTSKACATWLCQSTQCTTTTTPCTHDPTTAEESITLNPSPCRKVCNTNDLDGVCIMLCDPSFFAPSTADVVPRDVLDCDNMCNGDEMCVLRCAGSVPIDGKKRGEKICWELCDGQRCWPVCDAPAGSGGEAESKGKGEGEVGGVAGSCWEVCQGGVCWVVCDKPGGGESVKGVDGA